MSGSARRLLVAAVVVCAMGVGALVLERAGDDGSGASGEPPCQPAIPDALLGTTTSLRPPPTPLPAFASMEEAFAGIGLPPPPGPAVEGASFEVLSAEQGARFRRVMSSDLGFDPILAARDGGIASAAPWQLGDEGGRGTNGDRRFDIVELVLPGDTTVGGTVTVRECVDGRTELILAVNVGAARLPPCSNTPSLVELCRALLGRQAPVSSFEPPWLTESPTVTLLPDGRLQARLTTVRPNAPRAVEAIDDALLADGWTRDAPATFHRTVAGVEVVAVVEASPSPADPGALVIDRTFTTASAV